MIKARGNHESWKHLLRVPSDQIPATKKIWPCQNKSHRIALIDDVLNRLSDMTAAQISEYSHNDVPWLTTEKGKAIEYESVFYRNPPYSLREYHEDI